jgi:IS30 family transposase
MNRNEPLTRKIAEKQRLGDWEGDTVEGAKGSGYLTTMVSRSATIAGRTKLEMAGT